MKILRVLAWVSLIGLGVAAIAAILGPAATDSTTRPPFSSTPLVQPGTPTPQPALLEDPVGWLGGQWRDFVQRIRQAVETALNAVADMGDLTARLLHGLVYGRVLALYERLCGANPLVLTAGFLVLMHRARRAGQRHAIWRTLLPKKTGKTSPGAQVMPKIRPEG